MPLTATPTAPARIATEYHVGRVTVAAASVPFDPVAGATGDWHDVIALPGRDVAVIVGDAAGRGARAAPLKDALQVAVRRLTRRGATPAAILAHLRSMLAPIDDGLATVIYAVVRPTRGEVVVANAGHPPALLIGRDSSIRFLADSIGPARGAPDAESHLALGRSTLRPEETLVLYSDGLIETGRDRDVCQGFRHLAALAHQCAGAAVHDVRDQLVDLGLEGPRPLDDLTVVVVRMPDRA
jgi:serine phosphatase RsbU (regulator of sigma subunit)